MTHPAHQFIEQHVERVQALERDVSLAYWDAALTGSEAAAKRRAELSAQLTRIYANRDEFALLREWREDSSLDELTARQVELLYRAYLGNQKDDATIERMSNLEAEVEVAYSTFRGVLDGEKKTNNDLRKVLTDDNDSERRQRAWEASKNVGPVVRDRVLELVSLRNAVARDAGFPDYYHMSLFLQELDITELFTLLDDLERQTREPFRNAKEQLDAHLCKRFGVTPDALCPWHYADFFFQDAPSNDRVDLNPFFRDKDLVELATQTYDEVGLDVRGILGRSDLYPKDGKDQHAFCINVNRADDVRVLCNLEPDESWMATLLHELGHGVYDENLDANLPWTLREPAHTLLTEAIAMIMGRLTKDEHWLRTTAEVAPNELDRVMPHLRQYSSLAMLIFVRWCLVMSYFERDLYANPKQDLNTLWWDYVERFQMLRRPEGRDMPDWASKLHIALAPVYYHNYLLGEMVASQIHHYIVTHVNPVGAHRSAKVGHYLRDRLFSIGARYPWNQTITMVTAEPLTPRYFSEQFVTPS